LDTSLSTAGPQRIIIRSGASSTHLQKAPLPHASRPTVLRPDRNLDRPRDQSITMADGVQLQGRHGKSRVGVGRVWRRSVAAGGDVFVEWNVAVSVVSDCLPSYTSDDNSAIVATDSIKNTVRPFSLSSSLFLPSRVALAAG
jgi:hypothetical protein